MNRVLLIPTVLLLLIGIGCFWISAGKSNATGSEKPIVLCIPTETKTLDPSQMTYANDIRIAMALWEGLAAYDPQTLAPTPGVAESWDISPDRKTYTFHLRQDAQWSNGDPVTAQDFLFSWKRALTPSTGAEYMDLFKVIAGTAEYTDALVAYSEALAAKKTGDPAPVLPDFSTVGVHSPDPHTIIITLTAPCSYFLDLCAFPTFFPEHQNSMQPFLITDKNDSTKTYYDGKWTRPPAVITNGPFRLDEWKFKQYISLKPNPHYWDRKNVQCGNLVFKTIVDTRVQIVSYQDGIVDVITTVPDQIGDNLIAQRDSGQRHDIHYRSVFGTSYYAFNCTKKPYDDRRVRKALALAIDKNKVVRDVTHMNQTPLGVIVPPDSIPGYTSPEQLLMNIPEAKRLLADAGFPGGSGFPTLEILFSNDLPMTRMVAQAVGQMWEQNLGIKCSYKGLEGTALRNAKLELKFDVSPSGWYGDYVDPTTWLDLARTGNGNNQGKFSDAGYDKILDQAAAEPDPAKRLSLLHDAESLLFHDEFPFIPLYQFGDGMIFDSDKIQGLQLNVRLLTPLKWIHRP